MEERRERVCVRAGRARHRRPSLTSTLYEGSACPQYRCHHPLASHSPARQPRRPARLHQPRLMHWRCKTMCRVHRTDCRAPSPASFAVRLLPGREGTRCVSPVCASVRYSTPNFICCDPQQTIAKRPQLTAEAGLLLAQPMLVVIAAPAMLGPAGIAKNTTRNITRSIRRGSCPISSPVFAQIDLFPMPRLLCCVPQQTSRPCRKRCISRLARGERPKVLERRRDVRTPGGSQSASLCILCGIFFLLFFFAPFAPLR